MYTRSPGDYVLQQWWYFHSSLSSSRAQCVSRITCYRKAVRTERCEELNRVHSTRRGHAAMRFR